MKKLIIFLSCLFLSVGCACSNETAKDAVNNYLNDYKGLSSNVLEDIDDLVDKEDIDDDLKDTYKDIVKRQYKDLKYEIENETYDDDTASVAVKITVYDLYKVQKDASDYLNNNQDEFLTDGEYDAKKYLKYKLEQMNKAEDTISYNIVLKVVKVDGKWQVEQPSDETLEKIHGVYNYNEND